MRPFSLHFPFTVEAATGRIGALLLVSTASSIVLHGSGPMALVAPPHPSILPTHVCWSRRDSNRAILDHSSTVHQRRPNYIIAP